MAVSCQSISRLRSAGNSLDFEQLLDQIKAVEAERDALLAAQRVTARAPPAMLLNIKGIGPEFAAVLWSEGLFRHFDNRRQVASYAGLAPTPWQSGSVDREQGVSKAGNPRLRTTLIQLAWLWLRNQPRSARSVVQGPGQPQWRPSKKDDDRGAGAQAAGRAVEICDCRRRHRRRHCEERLKGDRKRLKQSTGTLSVSADPGGRTKPVRGLKSRYQEWSRPPEPRRASGILVQPLRAATECEVDLVRKRLDHGNGL